jgi:hypothetical protein
MPVNQSQHNGTGSRTMAGSEDGLYMDEEGDLVPHARGPDVVGSVDMGRVGGQDVEIRIGSPPPEEGQPTDPNDAQTVLPGQEGLPEVTDKTSETSGSEADDFEIVLKETEGANVDAMQVDETGEGTDEKKMGDLQSTEVEDGDIVLVDADGKTEDDNVSKADVSGENGGPDAADASTLT